jgi:hypothetical protein
MPVIAQSLCRNGRCGHPAGWWWTEPWYVTLSFPRMRPSNALTWCAFFGTAIPPFVKGGKLA